MFNATIVKKALMAVTGLILFGFIIGHLAGNLQVFAGPGPIDRYAAFLKSSMELLWLARAILLIAVIVHIIVTIQLASLKLKARPVSYSKRLKPYSAFASRSMYYSGPLIAAFVIYHLLDLTTGNANPHFVEGDVYSNLVYSFSRIPVSIAYIVAIAFLCLHLNHGIYSMFQTLGLSHPKYMPRIKRLAVVLSILIFVGYISIPISVLIGVIHL